MINNKLKRRHKPGYLKKKKKKGNVFLYFKPISLPQMKKVSFIWLCLAVLFIYFFNYLRIPYSIINLDSWQLQMGAVLGALFSLYKSAVLWTNKVIIKITPKLLIVKEKKTLFSRAKTKFKVRKKDAYEFYVDFMHGTFLTHHILMVVTSNQEVKNVVIATSPNLVNYLEFSILNHSFVKGVRKEKKAQIN